MSSRASRDSSRALSQAQGQVTTRLGQADIVGPGNMTATIYGDGQGGSYNLGNLTSANNYLTQLGTNASQIALSSGGLPAALAQALRGVQTAQGVPGMPDTTGLQGQLDSVLGSSLAQMNAGSAAPGLQSQAFMGAGQQLADAARGFGDVQSSTLANLRAQAAPFEQRAFDQLQNDQFGMGRLGTSGGALQTEAFARGLGQADLSRQLEATNQARLTQQNALGIGQGLAGIGSNMAALDDSLLSSAFGRFAQTAGLSQGLQQERFGNSMLLNQTGFDRANTNFQNQITAAQLPAMLQGSQLQVALQALQGQGFLNDQGMQQFQAALAAAQAGANARIGSGSNIAALAGARAQMPTSGDIWGQALTGIASRIGGSQSTMDALGGLFGRGTPAPTSTPPYAGVPNNFVGPR